MQVELRKMMDSLPAGRLQIAVIVMVAIVSILDGLDLQVVSFAAPLIMADWKLTNAEFAPILAAALVGMAFGTLIGGWLGDHIGRRWSLLISVMIFGLATIGCALTNSAPQLVVMRFIGGLGFGAAFPVGTAMVTEWMPRRWAGPAVTSMMIGIPLGGLIGAAITAQILPVVGWRMCFVIFGAVPAVLAVVYFFSLPESPAYLILKGKQVAVRQLLARAFGAANAPDGTRYYIEEQESVASGALSLLLVRDRRMSTGLWLGFFFQNIATYAFIGWTPVVLVGLGTSLSTSIQGLMTWNLFALCGVFAGAFVIKNRGTRFTMSACSVIGAIGAFALAAASHIEPSQSDIFTTFVLVGLAFEGFCVGGIQTGLFVVAANAYETKFKVRGIGAASTFGRLGGIASAFASGVVLGMGHDQFFAMISIVFLVVFASQFVIVRHFKPEGTNVSSRVRRDFDPVPRPEKP